ncbi:hypothetical protein CLW00_10563 [Mongoliibacter ruber]|uniref:Uncharacterized protein n=1 Tax=Mongoliibacter ruber TaxID=1750599 RepID=A0A2T0WMK7_9BACT|nr:hypothetical protein CLW00_10563 [Mongoliibacter ruber]
MANNNEIKNNDLPQIKGSHFLKSWKGWCIKIFALVVLGYFVHEFLDDFIKGWMEVDCSC